jgi:WD40 repeat protein
VNSVSFSPNGRRLVGGSDDDSAYVWDVRRRLVVAVLPGGGNVQAARFVPGRGHTVATAGDDGNVRLWQLTAPPRTVLPLGLVQPWGRRWPRWMPRLGGRRVPRWVVVAPVGLLAGGMILTFGTASVQFLLDPAGSTASSDYPLLFWWFVLPAYFTWGLGLAVLVVAYWHATGHTDNS